MVDSKEVAAHLISANIIFKNIKYVFAHAEQSAADQFLIENSLLAIQNSEAI